MLAELAQGEMGITEKQKGLINVEFFMLLPFLVTAIALARLHCRLRFVLHILRQRACLIVRLIKLSFCIAAHVAFI
jgi:hypothetical protein